MELHGKMKRVRTREDLAKFVADLRSHINTHVENWENPFLEIFLEAMVAWLAAKDRLEKNQSGHSAEDLTWKAVAETLYAAKIYE